MTTTTNTSAVSASAFGLGGELQNVGDLRREGNTITALLEQFEALGTVIMGWAETLPERYQAAPFGTQNLQVAVNGIGENAQMAGDMGQYIGLLDQACANAQGLGEQIAAQRAEGETSGYTPQ